jgi:AmpE protein
MKFLALVLALVLNHVWSGADRLQSDDWHHRWQARVAKWGLPGPLALALAVLGPTALAALVLEALAPLLFGLLWLAAAVTLLLYALGRGDFAAQMETYRRQARSENFEGAFLSEVATASRAQEVESPETPREVHNLAQQTLLYEGYQRWFAVVFFFLRLGPLGALAYRLLQLCRDTTEPELAARCLWLVDWIPARLLSATFVVTGDFVASRDEFLGRLQDTELPAGEVLQRVGAAAVDLAAPTEGEFGTWAARQNEEFGGLLRRSAGSWLVLVSLYVLL